MKRLPILAFALALALPVHAAEDDAKKGGKPGTNVDMPFLIAPVTNADGKLTGYAYISSRLTASSEMFALAVRDKLPFIQDAFVRDVNATPVTLPDNAFDIEGVEARLLADARRVIGAAKVRQMTICTVQISALHTPVTPTSNAPPDGAASAKGPEKSRCAS